jgi:VWFA-related protein
MRPFLVSILSFALLAVPGARPQSGEKPGPSSSPGPTFGVSVTDVQVDPEVLEGHSPLQGLTKNDFVVFDENTPQAIKYFGHEAVPLDLVLLLDMSGSVRKYLQQIAGIASTALDRLQPQDQVAVMLFGRNTWIEQAFTNQHEEIAAAIDMKSAGEAPVGSGTRIYAGVQAAARYVASQDSATLRRRAILIVTDNDGMSYDVHKDDALRALYDAKAGLDAIVVGRHPHPPVPKHGAAINPDFAFDDVFPLAEETGGEVIATSKPAQDLGDMLTRIRDRYFLVYQLPPGATAGSYRHIRVDLSEAARKKHPHAIVRARSGYYVNREEPQKSDEPQPHQ